MLIQHLKQLEADGLIIRTAKPVVPPHVTYKLSEAGNELAPVIDAMAAWAFHDMERNDNKYADGNRYRINKNQNGFGENLKQKKRFFK